MLRYVRVLSFVLVVTALFSAGLAEASQSATTQPASTPPAFGVQFHATWADYTDAERAALLDKLQAAGVQWVRIDLGWASLQEQGSASYSQWYVDLADRAVDQARARGLKVLATLWATPSWANGGGATNVPPQNVSDYSRVATWAGAHFRGRINAWEVWNEPNLSDFFAGSAAEYTELLRAGYAGLKAGDPNALVVLGGPSTNDTAWLKSVYDAGAKGAFDVMATHPYMGMADAPPETPDDGTKYTLAHVAAVYELMKANGDGSKPIWFTEFGWSSHANWSDVENWNRGVTAEQQADYLVRAIEYVSANFPYVTNMFWYNERNLASGNAQLDNYGLLNRDLSPKPAYTALRAYLSSAPAPAPAPAPSTTSPSAPAATAPTPPTTTTTAPPPTTAPAQVPPKGRSKPQRREAQSARWPRPTYRLLRAE